MPAAAVTRGPRPGLDAIVKVWSGAATATDNIVVSTVALLVETSNATGVATPTQTSVTTTTPTPTTTTRISTTTHATPTQTSVTTTTPTPTTTTRISTTTRITATTTTMPSITTIASSATTQASKENAEEALVVSPSPVEPSNSTFSEIIIGIGIVALCLILGYCGFRAIKAKSNNSAQTPLYMQDKNINSWRMRTKKNALAVAYMEQIDSGTSKGDREIQMTI